MFAWLKFLNDFNIEPVDGLGYKKKFFLKMKIGKWSEISYVIIPETVSSGADMKKLSMRVAELPRIRVGWDIIGIRPIV